MSMSIIDSQEPAYRDEHEIDVLTKRIAELEREVERYQKRADMLEEYIEGPQGWRASCDELESLVRDMWVELCCSSSGFDVKAQVDELGERMSELGIEVDL